MIKNLFLTYFLSPFIIFVLSLLEFTKLGPFVAPLASAPTTAGPIYLNFILANEQVNNLAIYSLYGMFSTIFSFSIYCNLIKNNYSILKTLIVLFIYIFINYIFLSFQIYISPIFVIISIAFLCIYGHFIPKYDLSSLPKKKINILIKVLSSFILINLVFFLKNKYINISAILSSFPVGAVSLIIPLHFLTEKKYIINFLQRYIIYSMSLLSFFTIIYYGANNINTFCIALIVSIMTSVFIYLKEDSIKNFLIKIISKK